MSIFFKINILLSMVITMVIISSCNHSKHLKKNEYLVHKNNIVFTDNNSVKEYELQSIIRQPPNNNFFGIRMKLWAYNRIDSTKMAEKIEKKYDKIGVKNDKKREKVRRKNRKRIHKAREKGKENFKIKKFIPVPYKRTLREWFKYTVGEPPVIYDEKLTKRTRDQMELYLNKSGYFEASVDFQVDTNFRKKRITVNYEVTPGRPHIIDTIIVVYSESSVRDFIAKELRRHENLRIGDPLDAYVMDTERELLVEKMENNAYHDFKTSNILYEVDTTMGDYKAKVTLKVLNKKVPDPNDPTKLIEEKHRVHYIKNIYFHLNDTTYHANIENKKSFLDLVQEEGFAGIYDDNRVFYLLDTIADPEKYESIMLYNGLPFVKPGLLENQNFLEPNNYYKKYYVERSYRYMLELGVFRSITPKLVKNNSDLSRPYLDVHYYLSPLKRQSFLITPRGTHSDGIIGVSASLDYTNLNLNRGAERLKVSLSGGFEYQPPIFTEGESIGDNKLTQIGFNTFEFGPQIAFSVPKLVFIPIKGTSKRQQPRTEFSGTYNFQNRPEYFRHLSNLTFKYIFKEPTGDNRRTIKTHQFSPVSLSFIIINTTDEFRDRIETLNDQFLRNSFINHFTLESIYNFIFQTESKNGYKKFRYSTQIELAGNLLNAFDAGSSNPDPNGNNTIGGVPYAQFSRIDNDIIYHAKINLKHSLHKRFQVGVGVPYGNSINLPFHNSFYAGGSTDIRAFAPRTLGPGSYFDTLNSLNQIGDIRLQGTLEYRFPMFSYVKGAVFFDYGNIWLINKDSLRAGGEFTANFYREIALGTGYGFRLDFDYFVIRLDIGFPLHNPALPEGERWIFMKRADRVKYNEIVNSLSENVNIRKPFAPVFNFGINYPF